MWPVTRASSHFETETEASDREPFPAGLLGVTCVGSSVDLHAICSAIRATMPQSLFETLPLQDPRLRLMSLPTRGRGDFSFLRHNARHLFSLLVSRTIYTGSAGD